MHRRRLLATVGAAASLAGCSRLTGGPGYAATGSPSLPVPKSKLHRGAPRDAIPAIVDPAFAADWKGLTVRYFDEDIDRSREATLRLDETDDVIGVVRSGRARAYPLRVLAWHEVVNDDFGGPLLVTYCPLCATGIAAQRRVDGETTTFGVSGLLYQSNLVMYDRATDSRWSQVRARAIRGPRTGDRLDLVPASVTTWGEWTDDHPDTEVLLPPPESNTVSGRKETRNYALNPYVGYADRDRVGVSGRSVDDRLHPKTLVVGVAHDGAANAYPLDAVRSAGGVVNDAVGGLPVVAVAAGDTLRAFVRRVDGERLTFEASAGGRMTGGGSTWNRTTGAALDGPHEGTSLEAAAERTSLYWFSWADLHPGTSIYGN